MIDLPRFSWLALFCVLLAAFVAVPRTSAEDAGKPLRYEELLDSGWRSIAVETGAPAPVGIETAAFDDLTWDLVDVPHTWDRYEGYRQIRHGNRHGTAWYRRSFEVPASEMGRRTFLYFEGVGSYATVWVNGRQVGHHAGGLTTFTLDVTNAVVGDRPNLVVVRADHPAGIRDLPWVCGGCERAYGFSEGPQPFGIFRPVHLVTTAPLRIEPFGVQVWNDAALDPAQAQVHVRTELKNYGANPTSLTLITRVLNPHSRSADANIVSEIRSTLKLGPGGSQIVAQEPPKIAAAQLWTPTAPALYTLQSDVLDAKGRLVDRAETTFGLRTVRWPVPTDSDARLFVNNQPVFLNGVCEYEHNLGANHAFSAAQIEAHVRQVEAAGFNAFRDAHHPHNLRYQEYWDRDGLLWWPQFGAHVWFDNDAFRTNFKALLREWVKERRNSPSIILWGLQNESVLPTEFAEECCAIIRELDPTASEQRKIVTCNTGTGTDWNVLQNWSGTYSGTVEAYADDLRREHLFGEYGAWRSLGLHSEGGFQPRGPLSEDRMTALLETKVRLAESVRDQVAGHFLWPLVTHANPGRNFGDQGEQIADGVRPLDRIGPANNKGLFTLWGEPVDAFFMYRSNYAPAATQPMVYIVSPSWPDRWTTPGKKSGLVVYSNCDEVELFNDLGDRSLGRRTRAGRGTHFQWDDVGITTGTLYAEGRIGGKIVTRDLITLHHLPAGPRFAAAQNAEPDLLASRPGRTYLYRVNCGGPDYTDHDSQLWAADHAYRSTDAWGALSWADAYPNLDPRLGSVRRIYRPLTGTRDPALFQTFRYGRDELQYTFTVPNGAYELELYFVEPWYGAGNGDAAVLGSSASISTPSAAGWRRFDVAVNGKTVLRDFDLAREFGFGHAAKKIVAAKVSDGRLVLSFPRVAVGQAVISAIAVARQAGPVLPSRAQLNLVEQLTVAGGIDRASVQLCHALDTGETTYSDIGGSFSRLPDELLESDWIRIPSAARHSTGAELLGFTVTTSATVFVAHAAQPSTSPTWLQGWEKTASSIETTGAPDAKFTLYRASFPAGAHVTLGGNAMNSADNTPMYSVFVIPTRPAPLAQLVRLPADASARVDGDARPDRELYADRRVRLASLPGNLMGGDLIRPTYEAKTVTFSVSDHVEVHLALDARVSSPPAWLADWIPTRDTVTTTDPEARTFALFRHRFAPDATVVLGANPTLRDGKPAAMYFGLVRAIRPSVLLEAEAATLTSAQITTGSPDASGNAAVTLQNGPEHAIEWTVSVGVGDRYGLNFRYTSTQPTPAVTATLTIIGADGRELRTDKIEFPAIVTPGVWTFLRTKTGASINAGTYRFRLTLEGAAALVIDTLEVE